MGVANYEAQENSGGSLTDSSKLEQQRTDASSSQTDEHKAMHTPQTCSHAAPNSVPCLADTGMLLFLSVLGFGWAKLSSQSFEEIEMKA